MIRLRIAWMSMVVLVFLCAATGKAGDAPTSSLLVQVNAAPLMFDPTERGEQEQQHALRQMSMFAIAPPQPPSFQRHDLIQIIVREQTQARSSHELDLDKRYRLDGGVSSWPRFSLPELLKLQIDGSSTQNMPEVGLDWRNRFEGDGDFRRRDDLTARITAEVIDVLPNGNIILEARSHIKIDKEEAIMRITGVARPDDVASNNTIQSNQIHNLKIEREHAGELRKTTQKGIIPQVLDFVFAF